MLNELLVVERGARQAGVEMIQRHPDIKDARRVPTLVVALDTRGKVSAIRPSPGDVTPWTLRDGQHNSFPFHQPKPPLLRIVDSPEQSEQLKTVANRNSDGRRTAILDLTDAFPFNDKSFEHWPGEALLKRIEQRRNALSSLDKSDAAVVPITLDRFLKACESPESRRELLESILGRLIAELQEAAQPELIEVAASLLIGKFDKKAGEWQSAGGILFEADGFDRSIIDARLITSVSSAMSTDLAGDVETSATAVCALTGRNEKLVSDKFPQPNVAILGQTFLFAKNTAIRANDRYGRFSTDAMPVGQSAAIGLAAAFRSLTSRERQGLTWRSLPGEAPKETDLLLAFVDVALDAPVADTFADDGDFSEVESDGSADSIAEFEKRTERVVEAVRGTANVDIRETPICVTVFRKVDPANRKVVYSGTPTVAQLYDSARTWWMGERNLPQWITLPIFRKGERKPRAAKTPHIAPLGLITFTKQLFIRNGTERQEVTGLPAAEALALFLDPVMRAGDAASRRAARVLRLVFKRRVALVAGTAHSLRKGFEFVKPYDRGESLRTITVLGILLSKLNRTTEVYMTDAAFRLGQLLAALDVVHAGYCADVRGGDVPPSLLGNQVFTTAQKSPLRALEMIGRRWKPYDGWAKKVARDRDRIDRLKNSNKKDERQRGWDIVTALRHAREIKGVADQLAESLRDCTTNDVFRAELLLGYMAGFPAAPKDTDKSPSHTASAATQEN